MHLIKPLTKESYPCPCCHRKLIINELQFWGLPIVAKLSCEVCQKDFFYTLPVGHFLNFPLYFNAQQKEVFYPEKKADWLHKPLENSFYTPKYAIANIRKVIFEEKKEIILLNCLDSVYGHSLWRLLNYATHREKSQSEGIILLIPKNLEWIFPLPQVSEIWIVENPWQDFRQIMPNLNQFIQTELQRFEKIWLSPAFIHLQISQKNLEKILFIKPFDLSTFAKKDFQVTFVSREDRFWLPTIFEYFLYRLWKHTSCFFLKQYFIKRQENLFYKLAIYLKKEFVNIKIYRIGQGKPSKNTIFWNDVRVQMFSGETEKKWNEIASQSHLIIGVHGSHLLLPTALSAGFIELIPLDRIENFGEGSILIGENNRFNHFLQRVLPLQSSVKEVFQHCKSILRGFPFLYDNTMRRIS